MHVFSSALAAAPAVVSLDDNSALNLTTVRWPSTFVYRSLSDDHEKERSLSLTL